MTTPGRFVFTRLEDAVQDGLHKKHGSLPSGNGFVTSHDDEVREHLIKWGLLTAPSLAQCTTAHRMLHRFRYDHVTQARQCDETTMSDSHDQPQADDHVKPHERQSASSLSNKHLSSLTTLRSMSDPSLTNEFLCCLFSAPAVQDALNLPQRESDRARKDISANGATHRCAASRANSCDLVEPLPGLQERRQNGKKNTMCNKASDSKHNLQDDNSDPTRAQLDSDKESTTNRNGSDCRVPASSSLPESFMQQSCHDTNKANHADHPVMTVSHVCYTQLSCNWTSLAPLSRLTQAGVIRRVTDTRTRQMDAHDAEEARACDTDMEQCVTRSHAQHGRHVEERTGTNARAHAPIDALSASPMPVRQRAELMLPGGIVVSDELRALLLIVNSANFMRRRMSTRNAMTHTHAELGHASAHSTDTHKDDENEPDCRTDDSDDEDWCDELGSYYDSFGSLPRAMLRRVFSAREQHELLYHVLWRLVAGGGAMNQYDNDLTHYRLVARAVMRDLLSDSLTARATRTESGAEESAVHYEPVIQAHVYAVDAICTAHGLGLYGAADRHTRVSNTTCEVVHDMMSVNLNYCYVVVHPLVNCVTVWYHRS